MIRNLTLVLTLIQMLAAAAAVAEPDVRSGVPDGPAPAADAAALAWLAGGTWSCAAFGGTAQETWLPPAGGQMAGLFRLITDTGPSFYEIMALLVVDGRLTMRLKHFDALLHGWEQKDETVDFPLVEVGTDTWYFDGLTLVREGPDAMALHLRVEEGGAEGIVTFAYRRDAPR